MALVALGCRTLPRVRELKQYIVASVLLVLRRTLPRVRELKPYICPENDARYMVAPFPGCVN